MKFRNPVAANGRTRLPSWLHGQAWRLWTDAWKDEAIPEQQLIGAERQLSSWLSGERVAPFDTCASLLRATDGNLASVLEVGCSSGYYSKVIGRHHPESRYVGVDYSQTFSELGRSRFPAAHFVCGDTVCLPFRDSAFPLMIS